MEQARSDESPEDAVNDDPDAVRDHPGPNFTDFGQRQER
jgi:hypothetical protein